MKTDSDFIDLLSHKLKSPLASIQAVLAITKNLKPGIKVTENLNKIENKITLLNKRIEDLIELISFTDNSSFVYSLIGINELIPPSFYKNKRFKINIDKSINIVADKEKINKEIIYLLNFLLENSKGKILIKGTTVGKNIFLNIDTDLIKYSEKDLFKLKISNEVEKGLGTEMYILSRIIKIHGGKINKNDYKLKSKFEIVLPKKPSSKINP